MELLETWSPWALSASQRSGLTEAGNNINNLESEHRRSKPVVFVHDHHRRPSITRGSAIALLTNQADLLALGPTHSTKQY